MLIRRPPRFRSSEITPERVYLDRREFMAGAGALLLGAGMSDERNRGARRISMAIPPWACAS